MSEKVLLFTKELEVDDVDRDGDLDAVVTKKIVVADKPYAIRHGLGRVPRRITILSALGGYPVVAMVPDANGFPQADSQQIIVKFSQAATVVLQIA